MRVVALCGLVIMSLLSGCASTSVVPVGSTTYPSMSHSEPVQIFQNETEVQGEYTVLGMITHGRNATTIFQSATFSAEDLEAVKAQARSIGANGVILDFVKPGGAYGAGLQVRARAIRIKEHQSKK